MRRLQLRADALLCHAFPRLARWTAVVVDRFDGAEYPVGSVRLRWRSSIDEWLRWNDEYLRHRRLPTAQFEARRLTDVTDEQRAVADERYRRLLDGRNW